MLQVSAQKHQVSLSLQGSPCIVYANREMVEEILYNLCDNAIRYNRPGGTVMVTAESIEEHVRLCVEDTGIGIPKEYQERIFERFYRVDKARSRVTGGSGLGLAITRRVILMHKGAIKLTSREGEGSVFTLRIPLNYIA